MWNVEKVPFTSVDAVCGANVTINVGKTNPFSIVPELRRANRTDAIIQFQAGKVFYLSSNSVRH